MEIPKNEIKLFPFQQDGVRWLRNRKCALLADEMGLGKSAQAIGAADAIKAGRILVICPRIACINWQREFRKFSSQSREFSIVKDGGSPIPSNSSIITSFNMAARIDPCLFGKFDVVIIDEAHFCKSTTTKRSLAIFGKKGIIHGQSKETRIWCLSGTPAPNHAGELWPILYTFGVTHLVYEDFIQRFCHVVKDVFRQTPRITGTKTEKIPELRRGLSSIMLRRTIKDVGHELPPLRIERLVVDSKPVKLESAFTFAQWFFPKNRGDELKQKLTEELRLVEETLAKNNLDMLISMAKSVSTLRRYIGLSKMQSCIELLKDELSKNLYQKVVVFAIHRDVIEGMRDALRAFHPLTLYGGTKFVNANRNLDKFKTYSKFRVFICNITAAGVAIDLTAANNILMVEQEWTPAWNSQAVSRCYRTGQTKPVHVRIVSIENSIDDRINEILSRKTKELTALLTPTKRLQPVDEEDDLLT